MIMWCWLIVYVVNWCQSVDGAYCWLFGKQFSGVVWQWLAVRHLGTSWYITADMALRRCARRRAFASPFVRRWRWHRRGRTRRAWSPRSQRPMGWGRRITSINSVAWSMIWSMVSVGSLNCQDDLCWFLFIFRHYYNLPPPSYELVSLTSQSATIHHWPSSTTDDLPSESIAMK